MPEFMVEVETTSTYKGRFVQGEGVEQLREELWTKLEEVTPEEVELTKLEEVIISVRVREPYQWEIEQFKARDVG